jgi:hypothetical protein
MEVFPTCIRQSGIGFCTLISQAISIGGPYVIYLGAYDLQLPYAIMFLVCFIGFCAATLLPETLHRNLPETIQEASSFGANDKFFSFLPAKKENMQRERERKNKEKALGKNKNGLMVDLDLVESSDSLYDWNPVMRASFGKRGPPKDVSPELVKGLLASHYSSTKESNIN